MEPHFLWGGGVICLLLLVWCFRGMQRRGIIRVLALFLLLVALSDPFVRSLSSTSEVVALFDVSKSISPGAQKALVQSLTPYAENTKTLSVLPFADRLHSSAIRVVPNEAGWEEKLSSQLQEAANELDSGVTNIGSAVSGAGARYENSPLLLLTDGFESAGNARQVARLIGTRGSPLFPVLPSESSFRRPALSLHSLQAPLTVNQGELVDIQATVKNSSSKELSAPLEITLDQERLLSRIITVPPGEERSITVKTPPNEGGLKRIRAVLKDTPEELSRWLSVKAKAKLLLLSGSAEDERVLGQLFSLQGYSLEKKIADGKSEIPTSFESYSAVVLNNVPAPALPKTFLPALRSATAEGGGVLLIGGEKSFGLGGYLGTPLEELSPVKFVPPQTTKKRLNSAVILLVDKSRSMAAEGKIEAAKRAAIVSIETLKEDDLIGVIGFDSAPFVVIPLAPVPEVRQMAERRLANLTAAGKTELLSALGSARQALRASSASRKHIIVLTDGKVPDEGGAYESEITRLRNEGVTLSSIAVGGEADVPFLMMLSQIGRGAFYQTLSPDELPQIFVQDIKVTTGEKTLKEKQDYRVQLGAAGLKSSVGSRFPNLRGLVQTLPKKEANLELVATADETLPLLASWRYEKGKVVAFTSDANGRWSLPWLSWPDFPRFWSGIIDSIQRSVDGRPSGIDFDLRYTVNRKTLLLDLVVYDEKLRSGVPPRVTGELTLPGGEVRQLPLLSTKKGRFETSLEDACPGDYQITFLYGATKLPPIGFTLPGESFGETPGMGIDFENLSALASLSGGSLNPDPLSLPQEEKLTETRQQLFLPFVVAAFLLLLLEAALRGFKPKFPARLKRTSSSKQPGGIFVPKKARAR